MNLIGRSACSRSSFSEDRKSTRLNSSHGSISYAVFCLKKYTLHRGQEAEKSNRFAFAPGIERGGANPHMGRHTSQITAAGFQKSGCHSSVLLSANTGST